MDAVADALRELDPQSVLVDRVAPGSGRVLGWRLSYTGLVPMSSTPVAADYSGIEITVPGRTPN